MVSHHGGGGFRRKLIGVFMAHEGARRLGTAPEGEDDDLGVGFPRGGKSAGDSGSIVLVELAIGEDEDDAIRLRRFYDELKCRVEPSRCRRTSLGGEGFHDLFLLSLSSGSRSVLITSPVSSNIAISSDELGIG